MASGEKSKALFSRALDVLPGGVNSPVRAFRAVGGTPPVVEAAQGPYLTDVDNSTYIDFVCSWGPLILGHSHSGVIEAITKAAAKGTSYGAPCPGEVELAEYVVGAYPGLEQVRFVSSGTEAVMSAIRLARGVTGRDLLVKFSGCYHGHSDSLLVAAGSGLATFGSPSSAGVPADFAKLTRVLPLDDDAALDALFEAEGDKIAAIIIEPIPANNGLLIQRQSFLQKLRDITQKHGALLIFDEVISGFRVGKAGAAGLYGITPDLATFGKVIGGGMPVGAFGGSKAHMAHLAPDGPVYQAGTLSGNPLAMAGGLATLKALDAENAWEKLEDLGQYLEAKLTPILAKAPIDAQLARVGSVFWLSLDAKALPRAAESISKKAATYYQSIFQTLLDRGINLAPSAYEVGFLSTAHGKKHIDALAEALDVAFSNLSR